MLTRCVPSAMRRLAPLVCSSSTFSSVRPLFIASKVLSNNNVSPMNLRPTLSLESTRTFVSMTQVSSSSLSFNSFYEKKTATPNLLKRFYATYPSHTKLGFPSLSPSMTKGNLISWKKNEGDSIKAGEVICEIETDKATMSFESVDEGFIAKILVQAGTQDVLVNKPIAIIVESKADIDKFKDYVLEEGPASAPAASTPAASTPAPSAPKTAPTTPSAPTPTPSAPSTPSASAPPSSGRVIASPAARSTAASTGVNLASVQGSGPSGRIIKADVLSSQGTTATAPSFPVGIPPVETASYTDIPNSNIRKVIASRLAMSKQTIPHYYLTVDCNVDSLLKLRTDLNNKAKGEYKLSVNDFIVKASALTLRKIPAVNSSWAENAIRRYNTIDINVAVNTEQGLFTPLIANADQKGLATINNSVKELAEKAKQGKLTATDLTIGTFTISNLGMFGIKHFAAVINPPQACILAVGGVEKRVVVDESHSTGGAPAFSAANFISVTLSCDHRVVDGALGAEWLRVFKSYLEEPIRMLL